VDPGTRATGYGVVEIDGASLHRVAGGVIRTASGTLGERLATIQGELTAVIEEFGPDSAAVESVFAAKNVRSALLLGHARGVVLVSFALADLRSDEYTPTQVKTAVVGYGAASKLQVQEMVRRLLSLPAVPPADEADALAVAICHGHASRVRGARLARLSPQPPARRREVAR
jgi:crossover junction endodeoxyribonuclease RuvC